MYNRSFIQIRRQRLAKTGHRCAFKLVFVLLLAGFHTSIAQPLTDTVVIYPVKDNTIYQRNIANSNGAGEFFIAGTTGSPYFNHALIMFDIAGNIPAGAVIQSATLTLHLAATSGNSGPYEIRLHRLLENWGEGTSNAGTQAGQGAPATSNDATWVNTFYPSSLWASAGGNFNATISGTQVVNGIGFYNWSSTGMITDIQGWLNNASSNFGWLLKSDETASFQAKRFSSKENQTPANRPILTIIYTMPIGFPPAVAITSPLNGATFNVGNLITLNANASDSNGTITKVEFYNNGGKFLEDSIGPYGLSSNEVEPGNFVLTAKAFDNSGNSTVSDTVRITVNGCSPTGTISAEGYTNIPGSNISDLTSHPSFPNSPAVSAQIGNFEYGPDLADNYGIRLRGYICAPQTGNYTFYIASDEQSELWLSTDGNSLNRIKIASVNTQVPPRAWLTFPSQKSTPVRLIRGGRYYIETLHKEGTGGDHLAVGWVMPDGTGEGPIGSNRLSPWQVTVTGSARNGMQELRESLVTVNRLHVQATPNPSQNHFTLVTRSNQKEALTITITDIMGRVVDRRSNIAASSIVQFGSKYRTGIYFVDVRQGDKREKLKLTKH